MKTPMKKARVLEIINDELAGDFSCLDLWCGNCILHKSCSNSPKLELLKEAVLKAPPVTFTDIKLIQELAL